MSNQQLACTYAALILAEQQKNDAESILAVTKAAGVEVSAGMAAAFTSALSSVKISEVLSGISFGGGCGAAPAAGGAAPAGGAAAAPAAAAKKEEPEEEGDDDMGFGLFD